MKREIWRAWSGLLFPPFHPHRQNGKGEGERGVAHTISSPGRWFFSVREASPHCGLGRQGAGGGVLTSP